MVVKYEINAYSLDEAKQKAAEMGLTIVKNVTPSWKNSNCPAFGTSDFKKFMVEMLDKKRLAAATGVVALSALVASGAVVGAVAEGFKEAGKVVKKSLEKLISILVNYMDSLFILIMNMMRI